MSFTTLRLVYTEASAKYRDGQKNSVLVITTGPHTDQSLGAEGLQQYIRGAFDPARPVAVNVIDFGDDPDRADLGVRRADHRRQLPEPADFGLPGTGVGDRDCDVLNVLTRPRAEGRGRILGAVTGGFWRKNGVRNGVRIYLTTHGPRFWGTVGRTPGVRSIANRWIINSSIYTMATRPPALSTKSNYTSWESLRDRTYSARHLKRDADLPASAETIDDTAVKALFGRPDGAGKLSTKSSLLFPLFAQWFVDGFLRTDPENALKNQSTHEIDLSQLYGQTVDVTDQLRTGSGGRLKSQRINGQEFPPYYFDESGQVKPEF